MPTEMRRTALWDLPVRLVHWSFVALIPALWWTATTKQDGLHIPQLGLNMKMLNLHIELGCVMLGLVVFRIMWGLIGSSTAQFVRFVKGPISVYRYLRGSSAPVVGHNPAGGWSVVAMLGLLAAQVSTGLFITTVDGAAGPLAYLLGPEYYDFERSLSEWHELGFNVLIALIALHIAAIIFYTVVKKDRLVPPMITGSRDFSADVKAPRMAPLWRAIPVILFAVALAWWIGKGAPTSLAQLNAEPASNAEDYM